jgi:hypothetical protein
MYPEAMVSPSSVIVPALQSLSRTMRVQGIFPARGKPVPRKKVSMIQAEKIWILWREDFDLTVWRVPTIIVCTSILWRADKPGKERGL